MKKIFEISEQMWQATIPPKSLQFCMTSVEAVPGKKNTLDVVCVNCSIILN